jgi:CheY-like chemotaxis protein
MTTIDGFSAPYPPARILLAEDDREFRTLVAMKLRGAGFDVTEVADGAALLERLEERYQPDGSTEDFDMVLSDIHMPRFNALEVMFGANDCLANTPVILLTAFGDAGTHELGLKLGALAVLDKPIRLSELMTIVCQVLGDKRPDPMSQTERLQRRATH